MSVPGPTSPDGVLAGPPHGLGAREPTPGTYNGAGRVAGSRVGGSPGLPGGLVSQALAPARKWGIASAPVPSCMSGKRSLEGKRCLGGG